MRQVHEPQPGDVQRTCANISKAKRDLGYDPKTSFEEGIAKTVQWYRSEYAPAFLTRTEDGYASETDDAAEPTEELKRTGRRPSGGEEDLDYFERRLPDRLPAALPAQATQIIESLHLEVLMEKDTSAQGCVEGAGTMAAAPPCFLLSSRHAASTLPPRCLHTKR
jgi:hypothetical protein